MMGRDHEAWRQERRQVHAAGESGVERLGLMVLIFFLFAFPFIRPFSKGGLTFCSFQQVEKVVVSRYQLGLHSYTAVTSVLI